MRKPRRIGLTASFAGLLIIASALHASADFSGKNTSDGVKTGLTRAELGRANNGLDIKTGVAGKGSFEYKTVYACQFNTPGDTAALCANAVQACAGNTPAQGLGPMVQVFRRELDAKGAPTTAWQTVGTTCLADLAPGSPVLGLGQIRAAFHNTPWSRPTVSIQPEGNVTLVTLPTYFAVTWPEAGFQPGEADSVTLLGQQVRIRPTLDHYAYVFGDGTTLGPTDSPGGPYPDGDITHAYSRAGTYSTHIDITFGGEFSVAGGAWVPIPDTVTVAGPVQTVTVRTAQARLVIK